MPHFLSCNNIYYGVPNLTAHSLIGRRFRQLAWFLPLALYSSECLGKIGNAFLEIPDGMSLFYRILLKIIPLVGLTTAAPKEKIKSLPWFFLSCLFVLLLLLLLLVFGKRYALTIFSCVTNKFWNFCCLLVVIQTTITPKDTERERNQNFCSCGGNRQTRITKKDTKKYRKQ